jgi:hypothetical protein
MKWVQRWSSMMRRLTMAGIVAGESTNCKRLLESDTQPLPLVAAQHRLRTTGGTRGWRSASLPGDRFLHEHQPAGVEHWFVRGAVDDAFDRAPIELVAGDGRVAVVG